GKAVGFDVKDKIAKAMSNYDARVTAAQGKTGALKDQARRDTINNQIAHMKNAEAELKTALEEYSAALKAFDDAKKLLRQEVDALIKMLPKPKAGQANLGTAIR